MNNTIVAIATPPGVGAIGIIRLTGSNSIRIMTKLFKSVKNKKLEELPNRFMNYGHIVNNGETIDEVMIVTFKSPYSYTKEEMVEIHTHGGHIAINEVFKVIVENGAVPGEAGEFTKRAFLNGRIDLVQAESIMDMISSKSKLGFDEAISNLKGKFSNNILSISNLLTDIIAQIEVIIDYPDEDIEFISYNQIGTEILVIAQKIESLVESYNTGKLIKDGIHVTIVGRPNAGKSSLMNALLKEDRAIVTHIPGTTRDVISEEITLNGIAINIFDTAGIRETEDFVENIGIEKSISSVSEADIILYVMDLSEPLCTEDLSIIQLIKDKKVILILNKSDLPQRLEIEKVTSCFEEVILIKSSLISELGAQFIEQQIVEILLDGSVRLKEGSVLTNLRHYHSLSKALQSLNNGNKDFKSSLPLDIIQFNLHEAYISLGEITGKTIDEDVVNTIFSKFCLGK